MRTSQQIRQEFMDFFTKKLEHQFVPSSLVVPHDDPTLLFTNAGMNQFKDVFLATGSRDYRRAVNSQKCIRAGGKHNDLEDVGKDTYHHTFFEMLGNWSFGDYFKKEAIAWAWELLTEVWGLDKSRLHATVFSGDEGDGLKPDEEAAQIWRTVTDIDPENIHLCGKKDNFWEMGDSGPCGPCSEIHVDLTEDGSGGSLVNADDARVIEIWNLVFIQFNRGLDGKLSPLPAQHVDTGMGFERITAVLQGKKSNYDTDVFLPLFKAIQEVSGVREYGSDLTDKIDVAYRVIADHIRCLTFALTDGAVPSNEGRGYVLRRILRRAVRHGRQTLGVAEPFLHKLIPSVVAAMSDAFPELKEDPQAVAALILDEEESFGRTLDRGIQLFEEAAIREKESGRVSARDAFMLHDTFGFPLDLTEVMAEERGMSVDVAGFEGLMEDARQKARGVGSGEVNLTGLLVSAVQKSDLQSEFQGYENSRQKSVVSAVFRLSESGSSRIASGAEGDWLAVVTEITPFYAEAGGQVGDTGFLHFDRGVFRCEGTHKVGDVIFHVGRMESGLAEEGSAVDLQVDEKRRDQIRANHTGTHLLNLALRDLVNQKTQQKGSLVDDEKLRFDFSNPSGLTREQVAEIESKVNADIAADLEVHGGVGDIQTARNINGLRAVFGEKYPDRVRIVSIGAPVEELLSNPENEEWAPFSIEFCGGIHLSRTSEAKRFIVVQEEAVAKGVRRILAFTGGRAEEISRKGESLLARLSALMKETGEPLVQGLTLLSQELNETTLPAVVSARVREGVAELHKTVKKAKKEKSKGAASDVVEKAQAIADGIEGMVAVATLEGADAGLLRTAMDVIRQKKPDVALLLGGSSEDKCSFVAAVPKELIDRGLKAGDWVREVAKIAGGGGGGRPDMAQAGGKDPSKLEEALEKGREYAAGKM